MSDDASVFENPSAGQRMRLLESPYENGGARFVLEIETEPRRGQYSVPFHFHPTARETFEVVSGRARFRVGDLEGEVAAGETILCPAGVPHLHPWSVSDEPLVVLQTTEPDRPDLRGLVESLQGAITIFGLAREGKVDDKGRPRLLQLAVIVAAAMPATYVAGPPRWLQELLLRPLARLGRALGYRNFDPRYGRVPERGVRAESAPPGGLAERAYA